jgi:hypothetical protein
MFTAGSSTGPPGIAGGGGASGNGSSLGGRFDCPNAAVQITSRRITPQARMSHFT